MSGISPESPIFRYKRVRCPQSARSLGLVTAGAFHGLASDLSADWAALQMDLGDDLAASRLARYWDVQDALVEGVFDICARELIRTV